MRNSTHEAMNNRKEREKKAGMDKNKGTIDIYIYICSDVGEYQEKKGEKTKLIERRKLTTYEISIHAK